MKNMLKNTLSSNQIDLIMKEKKRVRWTKDEVSSAMTLRYFGKRAYDYMLKDLNYPLPSISTLQKYARHINLREGILEDVLVFMGNFVTSLKRKDAKCILSFDEMKIQYTIEYDSSVDEVIGPHNYIQVVMARGVFKNWKQPIYIGFDKKMTREILVDIIKKLHNKAINVVGVVSDNCSSNISCWKELGVLDFRAPYFEHPAIWIYLAKSVKMYDVQQSFYLVLHLLHYDVTCQMKKIWQIL
uniref:DUF659 domain-containing protein n=1 Tax=Anopheles epiroticus TaxID=199890 RepID=A0A182PWN9_9DIPT